MSFIKDLNFGLKYEKLFLNYIKYDYIIKHVGNFKEYDILAKKDDIETKYEIKSDRLAYKTKNLCIEYECSKKPSGITTTEADYYGYFIINNEEYDLYIIPTEFINECIENKLYKRDITGGNGYKARFYLFSLDIFKEFKK